VVVLALVAGVAGVGWVVMGEDRWGSDGSLTSKVERYCSNPRSLGDEVTPFSPGQPAAAHIDLPQPSSSLEQRRTLTAPASPQVGAPTLDLDASIGLVSLAVCLAEEASEPAGGTCDYRLTNRSSLGEPASAPLLATTYRAEIYDLRSGEVLTSGELQTPADRCPELAYISDDGVSNSLDENVVMLWLASKLPGGIPS
jgi:hypothetical protein